MDMKELQRMLEQYKAATATMHTHMIELGQMKAEKDAVFEEAKRIIAPQQARLDDLSGQISRKQEEFAGSRDAVMKYMIPLMDAVLDHMFEK